MESLELLDAAKNGDLAKLKKLAKAEDLNQTAKNGRSALIVASEQNNKEVVDFLLAEGADPNITTSMGGTALSRAAENGNTKLMEKLLDYEANIDDLSLITAAREGHLDAVKLLVERGANVNARQRWGQTALMFAAREGHSSIVSYLLQNGAKVRIRDKNDESALSMALDNENMDIVAHLRRAGAKAKADNDSELLDEDETDDSIVDTPDFEELDDELMDEEMNDDD